MARTNSTTAPAGSKANIAVNAIPSDVNQTQRTLGNTTAPDGRTHERFSWLRDGLRGNMTPEYVAMVKDVASGVALMLGLVQMSNLDRDGNNDPVLSIQDTETMLLAAMRATEILCLQTDELLDKLADINAHQMAENDAVKPRAEGSA